MYMIISATGPTPRAMTQVAGPVAQRVWFHIYMYMYILIYICIIHIFVHIIHVPTCDFKETTLR